MAELNYVPNTFARRLSSGRAMAIGVILGWQMFNPYISKLLEGAFLESSRLGYSISLFLLENENVENILKAFRGKQVDGFILDTPSAMLDKLGKGLADLKIPYVIVNPNSIETHPHASFVHIDDMSSAQMGAEYLIRLGHRRIGFVTVYNELISLNRRIKGYKKALDRAGIDFGDKYVIGGNLTKIFENGYNSGLELIKNYPEITAIFAATDDIAMGVMQAIRQLGLKIPEDISVMGFDDNYYAPMTAPPLTTIHQPVAELAGQAVRLLVQLFDDTPQESKDVILPTHLEIRDSCASPRQQG